MTTEIFVTVFYSNYSGNSKALLQFIKNANLMERLSLKYVNIDNKKMRNEVSKKFSVVPTIVVMVDDEISLYSGDNAFEWFNLLLRPIVEEKNKNEVEKTHLTPLVEDNHEKKKTIMELAAELSKEREKN